MHLFRAFILRRLAQEPLRPLVTVLGIALGIGVVVAIQLANASSLHGFETAIETVSGKTSLEIIGPGRGFDENRLLKLGWLREYGEVSPVIEGEAIFSSYFGVLESLRVLGIDILRDRPFRDYQLLEFGNGQRQPTQSEFLNLLIDPASLLITEKFASRHQLAIGSSMELVLGDRVKSFTIRGLLKDEGPARVLDGNFALLDIAAAQLAFDRLGKVDRLEIRLRPGMSLDICETAIARNLPEGLMVQRPMRRGRQVEKILEAFHFNLTALSYIALLVGLFLIYNTVSISVIARRQEIGILRSLGVARKRVLMLFLSEAALLALIGCSLGLLVGRWLASVAVQVTSTTVNTLYIAAAAKPVPLSVEQVVLSFAVGLPLSLLAAALPALEASRVPPTAAIRGAERLEVGYRFTVRYLIFPAVLFLLSAWFSTFKPISGLPIFGYAAAVAIVFGAAFLVPAVLYGLSRVGDRPLTWLFKVEGKLANANLMGAISRISISVAALAVSLSMMVALAVMIGSFRETVKYWVEQTLKADLYVAPATRSNVASDATISPQVERIVAVHPAVAAVDRFRNLNIPYGEGLVTLGAGEFSVLLDHGNLLFKAPRDGHAAMRTALGTDAVVVSESFALKYGMAQGDRIVVPTPGGSNSFRIAAVYYDYSSDRGVIVMDRSTFVRHFGEQQPTSLTVYLHQNQDAEQVRTALLKALGRHHRVRIHTNASLRTEVLRIFDSTFTITYALEIIAIFVALLGIGSTLLTLILERRRDLAVLRLVGADRGQTQKMVVIEALLLGGVSQSIGISVGLLLSLVLIYVINVQSFGWTIQFHLPWSFLWQSSVLVLVATALSGLYPARWASEFQPTEPVEAE